jgi:hypothetical protein
MGISVIVSYFTTECLPFELLSVVLGRAFTRMKALGGKPQFLPAKGTKRGEIEVAEGGSAAFRYPKPRPCSYKL